MPTMFRGWAAMEPGAALVPYEWDAGELGRDEIEVAVRFCGICRSDLSMIDDDWTISRYPLVPGHEIVGDVVAVGEYVTGVHPGQTVGIGWYSGSCNHCVRCLSGRHNLCDASEGVIVGRHGGFADRVRCREPWAVPIPDGVDPGSAGPLFCGGITVFTPILEFGVSPLDRVGVVGIGGLGHLAVQFLAAWGCHVTAFTTTPEKADDIRSMGAHEVVGSREVSALDALAGSLDFLLVTVNVPLDWDRLIATLAPGGRMHLLGGVPEPVPVRAFSLITAQRSISGSPVGSPAAIVRMLDFCARHGIVPMTERFPMARVNEALERLRTGRPRYRIVLEADPG